MNFIMNSYFFFCFLWINLLYLGMYGFRRIYLENVKISSECHGHPRSIGVLFMEKTKVVKKRKVKRRKRRIHQCDSGDGAVERTGCLQTAGGSGMPGAEICTGAGGGTAGSRHFCGHQ